MLGMLVFSMAALRLPTWSQTMLVYFMCVVALHGICGNCQPCLAILIWCVGAKTIIKCIASLTCSQCRAESLFHTLQGQSHVGLPVSHAELQQGL